VPYVNHSRVTKWTLAEIADMLATDDAFMEKAIVNLHNRQTELEKQVRDTYVDNERGLQVADAKVFSAFAEKILRESKEGKVFGTILSHNEKKFARRPWHRAKTPIPTICKYRRQVLSMIEAQAKRRMNALQ